MTAGSHFISEAAVFQNSETIVSRAFNVCLEGVPLETWDQMIGHHQQGHLVASLDVPWSTPHNWDICFSEAGGILQQHRWHFLWWDSSSGGLGVFRSFFRERDSPKKRKTWLSLGFCAASG